MLLQRLQVPLRIISAGRFARHQCPLSNIKIWTIQQASKAEEEYLHLNSGLLSVTVANSYSFYISVYNSLKTFASNLMLFVSSYAPVNGMFTFCRILVSTAWGSLPHSRSSI